MAYATTSSNITYTGISVSPGESPAPAKAPKSLIATRAVEVKGGWAGQVIVGGEVLLQKGGFKHSDDAEMWATKKVLDGIKSLFKKPR